MVQCGFSGPIMKPSRIWVYESKNVTKLVQNNTKSIKIIQTLSWNALCLTQEIASSFGFVGNVEVNENYECIGLFLHQLCH